MLSMVGRFPEQLREGIQIGKTSLIQPLEFNPIHIYLAGMGGSGIGGDFVSKFIENECSVPYLVYKSYETPAFINEQSVVLASSYSGNTEETLANVHSCIQQGAHIICIASGGKLIDLAQRNGLDYIKLPEGWSSPRACLGYSLVAQLMVLHKLGMIGNQFISQIESTVRILEEEKQSIQEKARHLAASLFEKNIIIYSTDKIEPVAVRFRQQINENAKRLCSHHVIPEMNHNELVGWRETRPDIAVLFLRNSSDYSRNKIRMDLSKDIVSHFAGSTIELFSKGESMIEKSLYLVHLLDYASVYLAELNQVDSVEVKVIDYLKAALSEQA